MYDLITKIWTTEEIPKDWKQGHIIKLPKKGDLRECKNYRGITLLSVPGKVLNRILLDRITVPVDLKLRENQAGFRSSRSCVDQIATLRIIIEQSIEWNSPLYLNFIDYEKAFDSVDRDTIWQLLSSYGIPQKIITMIKATYDDSTSRVIHKGKLSNEFKVKTGVRQGCLLSPFLFLIAIDWIMTQTTKNERNGIQWTPFTQLDDLDFADDLALLTHTIKQMIEKTILLNKTSNKCGLFINKDKTKTMRINATSNELININDSNINDTNSFTYLGSIVNTEGGTDEDIKARLGKARSAFQLLKNVWASSAISKKTKLRIFNSNVKSVLFYGSETWRTTKNNRNKIQTFINSCLRKILKIFWPNTIKNEGL